MPLDERKRLVAELFDIITGRVKEFVFKHDSVRVIQTAVKYANGPQLKNIAKELKGEYAELAQGKYSKFLVAKLLTYGDAEVRQLIVPEFYGHIRRLIRNNEASWVVDDTYRSLMTAEQKATILREWYGPEFALFKGEAGSTPEADLSKILEQNPEKRAPIMRFLLEMINQMVQKKTTGFTMLHDAMLQYFLNVKPGTEEHTEFIELLKGDEEGDLLKNLAFTKSGSKIVCLALAYSNAKDRKLMLRTYKDTVRMMAEDVHGHSVLLACYDVIDDTVLTSKLIFPELIGKNVETEEGKEDLIGLATHLTARIPILYLFAPATAQRKWLLPEHDLLLLAQLHGIRQTTSKKDPTIRRNELAKALAPQFVDLIASHTASLVGSSFGCQFITELLLEADPMTTKRADAFAAIAELAALQPGLFASAHAGRMLKTFVQGGRFNTKTKEIEAPLGDTLGFDRLLYQKIRPTILDWATGDNSFVVLALMESEAFSQKTDLKKALVEGTTTLQKAVKGELATAEGPKGKGKRTGNKGAELLLGKL